MRTLIIGGSGNLSAAVTEALLQRGDNVTVLTRGRRPVPAGCRLLVADRHDRAVMDRVLRHESFDHVLNFLGYDIHELQIDVGVFCDRIRQYLFLSSATVYAKPHRQLPLTEQSPLGNAYSAYAQKKLACEEWLRERGRAGGFPVTIVRPSHTYSSAWVPNPVHSAGYTFAARLRQGRPVFLHDGGTSLWTLTAASDFAAGLVGLVGLEAALGETYHITSDEALPWGQIYAEIAQAFGVSAPRIVSIPTDFICASRPDLISKLRGDKSEPGVFDNAKIKAAVPGFTCRTSLRAGLQAVAAWFDADPARQATDPAAEAIFDQVLADWRQVQG